MTRCWVTVVTMAAGCATVNRAGLVAMEAGVACDWASTRSAASDGWAHRWEGNPVLGRKPDIVAVDTYMIAAMYTLAVVYHLLPERWRPVLWAPVVAAQINQVAFNAPSTGWCGL